MPKKPQLYKFKDIENRLHTLEQGKSYIKPFVTSKVSDTMSVSLYTSDAAEDMQYVESVALRIF